MRLRKCQRAAAAPISHPYLRARSSLLQERAAAPANSRRVRYEQNRQEEAAYQQDDDYEQEHRHACCCCCWWCCWRWRRWWYSSPTAPSPRFPPTGGLNCACSARSRTGGGVPSEMGFHPRRDPQEFSGRNFGILAMGGMTSVEWTTVGQSE